MTRSSTLMEEKDGGAVSLSYASVDGIMEVELERKEIPDVIEFLQEVCNGTGNK